MDGFWPTFIRRKQTPPRSSREAGDRPAESFLNPGLTIIPLQETPEETCDCLVKPKEEVSSGQKIGERGEKPFRLAVHATVSGKVKELDTRPVPQGWNVLCAVIESSGKEEPPAKIPPEAGNGAELLLQAGIPLDYPRLSGGNTDVLLVNGTDFEPNLAVHPYLFRQEAARIAGGLSLLLDIFSIPKAYICADRADSGLIRDLEKALEGEKRILPFPARQAVPSSGETALAREVLKANRENSARAAFVNPAFLPAVWTAVRERAPFLERPITVSGSAIPRAVNLRVRIGTPFGEAIARCGGDPERLTQIVMGGVLTGISQPTAQVPVTPRTEGVLALVSFAMGKGHQSKMYQEGPCIRCAKCVDRCPVRVLPNLIAGYCRKRMFAEAVAKGLFVCIDCGLCTYVCPARIPLGEILREAKSRKGLRPGENGS
jgi:Na+-translocating ferredoxin:NAD+ oxidoreductase subunit C